MGKGSNKQLLNNSGTAQQAAGGLRQRGNQDYGTIDPILTQEAENPQGYTPQQLAYMNTASQQSLGGATSAVTGQANLEASRTGNAGGFQGAIESGSRDAMKQNSQNSVNIQAQQANLQQQQRQQALQSLQSLYGTNQQDALGYLNSSNSALGEENQHQPFGQQVLLQAMSNANKAASGAAQGG